MDIVSLHCQSNGDRYKDAALYPVSIMGHAGCHGRQLLCPIGIIAGNIAPAVGKDLTADLFGHGQTVDFPGTGKRCLDPLLKIFIGGVLSGYTDPAPPEETFVFLQVIQKGIADRFGIDRLVIQQGSDKE